MDKTNFMPIGKNQILHSVNSTVDGGFTIDSLR